MVYNNNQSSFSSAIEFTVVSGLLEFTLLAFLLTTFPGCSGIGLSTRIKQNKLVIIVSYFRSKQVQTLFKHIIDFITHGICGMISIFRHNSFFLFSCFLCRITPQGMKPKCYRVLTQDNIEGLLIWDWKEVLGESEVNFSEQNSRTLVLWRVLSPI